MNLIVVSASAIFGGAEGKQKGPSLLFFDFLSCPKRRGILGYIDEDIVYEVNR